MARAIPKKLTNKTMALVKYTVSIDPENPVVSLNVTAAFADVASAVEPATTSAFAPLPTLAKKFATLSLIRLSIPMEHLL